MATEGVEVLSDIGEFEVIEKVIFPALQRNGLDSTDGNDCAFVEIGNLTLAMSADVGPRPLIRELKEHRDDFESAGWHAFVATASDIATTGAKPLCMVNTVDAPPDLPTADLERYLDGFFRGCSEYGFANAGGDIRQGKSLVSRAFGVGVVDHPARIGRNGAQTGDHLIVIGNCGEFISSFLKADSEGASSLSREALELLRFPRPQISPMRSLTERDLVVAASDSSDGLVGALLNILAASRVGATLKLSTELLPVSLLNASRTAQVNPWNLFFFWGDWSVLTVVRRDDHARFWKYAEEAGLTATALGVIGGPSGEAKADVDGEIFSVNPVRNENFVPSGFNSDIRAHVDHMLSTPIFA